MDGHDILMMALDFCTVNNVNNCYNTSIGSAKYGMWNTHG